MDTALLSKTAAAMVAKGKGILAADESSATCETRFKSVGVECTEENRRAMEFPEDFVVIHDPQPAALVPPREQRPGKWVWRCHIDSSRPNRAVWNFLRPFLESYDAALFSAPSFTQGLPIPHFPQAAAVSSGLAGWKGAGAAVGPRKRGFDWKGEPRSSENSPPSSTTPRSCRMIL